MVAFVSTLGVFPNVASEQHIVESMNLGKSMRVMLNQRFNILHCLTSGNKYNDHSQISYVDNKI